MIKYFLKISFTLLFLTLLKNIVSAEVKLISPYNGEILEDRVVHFKWENTNPDIEFVYQHVRHLNGRLNSVRVTRSTGSEEELTLGLVNSQIYFWEVRYHPKESFDGVYDYKTDIFVLGINQEIPDYAWELLQEYNKPKEKRDDDGEEILVEEPKEEIEEEIRPIEEKGDGEEQTENREVVTEQKKETRPKEIKKPTIEIPITLPNKTEWGPALPTKPKVQEEDYSWNIKNSSVLGVTKTKDKGDRDILCKFKYYKKDDAFEKVFCKKTSIEVLGEKLYPFSNEYSIYIEGEIVRDVKIQVDAYDCISEILKPGTWFRCNEKFLGSEVLTIRPHIFFRISQNNLDVPIRSFSTNSGSFKLVAGYIRNENNLKITQTYRIINRRYDIFYDHKTELPLDRVALENNSSDENTKRVFRFPFNKTIGVTQWYGDTEFQHPHTGIDFGATKEKVVSVEDGKVVGKGWDSYYGKCLSGGNFLKVKHPNGMHTTYFHLEDTYVNTGDLVKKGQVIAKSGNSGTWNCQKLAYHLHFETRLNSSYKSHTNPVPYIDVDWNKVPTLGAKYNPGRLSGENPHPGR